MMRLYRVLGIAIISRVLRVWKEISWVIPIRKKDYLDIHAILTRTNFDLQDGLAAAQAIYGNQYNPAITLKSLAYFKEGNVTELSEMIREDLVKAIKNVRLENIPTIKSSCIIGEDLAQGLRL